MTDKEKQEIFVKRTMEKYPTMWKAYADAISHEIMSPDELMAYNFQKRIRMAQYAYDHTRFYKRLYDEAGVLPSEIKDEDGWEKLPIVTKEMCRANRAEMCVADNVRAFGIEMGTGGSTGMPLKIIRDRRTAPEIRKWRARGWAVKREPGELFSRDFEVLGVNEGYLTRVSAARLGVDAKQLEKKEALWWPTQRFYLNIEQMKDSDIEIFLENLNQHGMPYVIGYCAAVDEFARAVQGRVLRSPQAVFTTAMALTAPLRRTIEGSFGCPVCNVYGSVELSYAAIQCWSREDAMHVVSDAVHLELIDEQGRGIHDGSVGITVLTSLDNYCMPLIRYRQGDRTSFLPGKCECGLPFPRIANVGGRETHCLIARDGRKLCAFSSVFDFCPMAVLGFQYVQHENGRVTMLIIPNRGYPNHDKEINDVVEKLRRIHEGDLEIEVRMVDNIPHVAGKLQLVVHD